ALENTCGTRTVSMIALLPFKLFSELDTAQSTIADTVQVPAIPARCSLQVTIVELAAPERFGHLLTYLLLSATTSLNAVFRP
ncbi:hypothetical protein NQ358_24535, partial [Escherichia coli]|nr:hypothetical protein [Escherichia coli]